MKILRFTADARAEFLAEVAYYNEAAAGLGNRFVPAPGMEVIDRVFKVDNPM